MHRPEITIEPYNRCWAVYEANNLVCVCVYKKGAREVKIGGCGWTEKRRGMMMECQICYQEVRGDVNVFEGELSDGSSVIQLVPTPDRNWICCDSCNLLVCHNCCTHPESGYCDQCIEKYNLHDYLVEVGLIAAETGGE